MEYKHISPAAVAAILAAGDIAITLLEVPTGRFADRFGHRCSLIVGSVIQTVAMLLCWLGEGVPGLLLASLCVALGDTFRSGADQALLYESCAAVGEEKRFQQIEGKTHSLELIALVAMSIAGGVLVETSGFAAAWIAETACTATGIAIALAMVSPPATPPREGPDAPARLRLRAAGRLLRLIGPAAVVAGVAIAAAFIAQTGGAASPTQLTVLVSVMTLAEAAGAMLSRYLRPDIATQYRLLTASLLCCIAIVVAPAFFVPGVVALALLMGAAEPLRASAIQMLVEERRAEAASWASALDGAIRTLFLLLAGVRQRRRRGVP